MKATHLEQYFQVFLFSNKDVDESQVCVCACGHSV